MNFSSYIAKRYFFAKTSRNAVNIISGISVSGILVGTLALFIVLSAFNGLEDLVKGFYNTFDPDLKVSLHEGKFFSDEVVPWDELEDLEGLERVSAVLEERVLLTFQNKEYVASLKGIDPSYTLVTGIDSAIVYGENEIFSGKRGVHAVMGIGVSYYLGYDHRAIGDPIQIFVPKTGFKASAMTEAFSSRSVYPSGIFRVQPEVDAQYIFTKIDFAQNLLSRQGELSHLEVKVAEPAQVGRVQKALQQLLGANFKVETREEQQAVFFKVMKTEALFTFLVFALILGIASFTIMGSLSMLMLDKKEHLRTLHALGAEVGTLRQVFFKEGLLISLSGGLLGLVLGVALVYLQQQYGLLQIGSNYAVEAYPVALKVKDIFTVGGTVLALSALVSWLTARRLTHGFLKLGQ